MQIIEKEGQRVAVLDSLVSGDTGLPLEIPVPSATAESTLLEASRLGQNMAENFMRNFGQPDTAK